MRADRRSSSPYTARESPPSSEQLIPGAIYRRDDLVTNSSALIRRSADADRAAALRRPASRSLRHPPAGARGAGDGDRRGRPATAPAPLHPPLSGLADGRRAGDGATDTADGGHAGEWRWQHIAAHRRGACGQDRTRSTPIAARCIVMAGFLQGIRAAQRTLHRRRSARRHFPAGATARTSPPLPAAVGDAAATILHPSTSSAGSRWPA